MASYAALYMADSSPQNVFLNSYCGVAALVLLAYEHMITFDKEVNFYWRGNISRASALFLFNRYLALVAVALPRLTMQRMESEMQSSCICLRNFRYPSVITVGYLRAFALSEAPYRWPVTSLVLVLALVPFGLNLTQFYWLTPVDSDLRCIVKLSITANMGKNFAMICRICAITSDLIVLGVAVNATYKTSTLVRRAIGYRNSPTPQTFTGTILRDGAIYFIAFLILNVAHLVFTWLSLSIDSLSAVSFLTMFTQPLAAILISRFLSNLQEVKQHLASPRSLPRIGSVGTIHLRPLGSSRGSGTATDVSMEGVSVVHGTGLNADVRPAVVLIEEVYHADA